MATLTPQTPDELLRDVLGTIARTAHDIEDSAMKQDLGGLDIHYNFLKSQMNRLEVIRKNVTRRY